MKKVPKRSAIKKTLVRVDLSTPCADHLSWHKRYQIDHESIRSISIHVGRSPSTVHEAIKRCDEWFRQTLIDDIVELRHRHADTLEAMATAALKSWRASIGNVIITTTKDGKDGEEITVRKEISHGHTAYLAEARAAMADVRRIWGADKPTKIELGIEDDGEGLGRVCGISVAEACRQEAAKMLALATTHDARSVDRDKAGDITPQ